MKNLASFYVLTLFLFLNSCGSNNLVWEYESQTTPVENVQGDPEIDVLVKPYQQGLQKEMNEVITYCSNDMMKEKGESTLGNFVSDLAFQRGKNYIMDEVGEVSGNYMFAFFNFGGLRSTITKGEVTVGDIFSLMPFDNEIVVLKLSGAKVQELIDYNLKYGGQPSSNIEWSFSMEKGERNEKQIVVGNKNFDEGAQYYVITSDYLAGGGDNMNFFKDPIEKYQTGILLRDAILDFSRSKDDIFTPKDQRWYESN